jgi:uncharacterized membrane protein (UPF0127 family)
MARSRAKTLLLALAVFVWFSQAQFASADKTRSISAGKASLSLKASQSPSPQESTPVFRRSKIRLAERQITVELADTPELRERGLMFRNELPENQGMLFVFESEQRLSFWMLNTLIPLSIGYFDRNKVLLEVYEMEPMASRTAIPKTYPSQRPALYALEMPKGWYFRHGVKPGAKFEFLGSKP